MFGLGPQEIISALIAMAVIILAILAILLPLMVYLIHRSTYKSTRILEGVHDLLVRIDDSVHEINSTGNSHTLK